MFSQATDYALRAVLCLARRPAEPFTVRQVAEATCAPAPYLSKIMQMLCRKRLVASLRGLHGGFRLNRQPSEITLLDVVEAIEPIKHILACPLGIHKEGLCPLHRRLEQATLLAEGVFREATIAMLIQEGALDAMLNRAGCVCTASPLLGTEANQERGDESLSAIPKRA